MRKIKMNAKKRCSCAMLLMVIICAMSSCMRKDDKPQPLQSKTVMTEVDAGPVMALEGDTILAWTGADGENRIAGLVDGKKSGISIIFGYPMRIFVSHLDIYRNGKLVKVVSLNNMHPVYEESDSAMAIYDKHGMPATDCPNKQQYDYFHNYWKTLTEYE